jgi:hypothetical protein
MIGVDYLRTRDILFESDQKLGHVEYTDSPIMSIHSKTQLGSPRMNHRKL